MSYELMLSALMLGATAMVVFCKQMMHAVIASSVFSMFLTLKYFTLNAPDVAITEAALGAGLSTLVFLVAIYKTQEYPAVISLPDFLSTDRFLQTEATRRDELMRVLVEHCLADYPQAIRYKATEAVKRKSDTQQINLGRGFALSHARMDSVRDIHVSVGLLPEAVRYFKGDPARTVFCVVLPDAKSRVYLSFMARLTRFLEQDAAVAAFESRDPQRIAEAIREFEES